LGYAKVIHEIKEEEKELKKWTSVQDMKTMGT
jgi:hypothetical protein